MYSIAEVTLIRISCEWYCNTKKKLFGIKGIYYYIFIDHTSHSLFMVIVPGDRSTGLKVSYVLIQANYYLVAAGSLGGKGGQQGTVLVRIMTCPRTYVIAVARRRWCSRRGLSAAARHTAGGSGRTTLVSINGAKIRTL